MARYWLVKVDGKYMSDTTGLEFTTKKTLAARLRYKDRDKVKKILLLDAKFSSVSFVPTTYKPSGTEFIEPTMLGFFFPPKDESN